MAEVRAQLLDAQKLHEQEKAKARAEKETTEKNHAKQMEELRAELAAANEQVKECV